MSRVKSCVDYKQEQLKTQYDNVSYVTPPQAHSHKETCVRDKQKIFLTLRAHHPNVPNFFPIKTRCINERLKQVCHWWKSAIFYDLSTERIQNRFFREYPKSRTLLLLLCRASNYSGKSYFPRNLGKIYFLFERNREPGRYSSFLFGMIFIDNAGAQSNQKVLCWPMTPPSCHLSFETGS